MLRSNKLHSDPVCTLLTLRTYMSGILPDMYVVPTNYTSTLCAIITHPAHHVISEELGFVGPTYISGSVPDIYALKVSRVHTVLMCNLLERSIYQEVILTYTFLKSVSLCNLLERRIHQEVFLRYTFLKCAECTQCRCAICWNDVYISK